MLDYQEAAPPDDLAGVLQCVWTMRGAPGGAPERVLSDGSIEIVFNLGDRFRRHAGDGRVELQPTRLLVGPLTGHIRLEPTGAVDLVGLRLRPGAASAVWRGALEELRDQALPLDDLEHGLPRELFDRLGEAPPGATRVELALGALRRAVRPDRVPPAVSALCRALGHFDTPLTVDEAAARAGLERRTAERLFQRHVGLPPKRLQRILRVHAVLRLVHRGVGFAAAAVDAGYYDQPHFLRDFRDLAGVSPGEMFGGDRSSPMARAFTAAG
jgi:AraC-like DNA-binding protein